jgi:hypothetical protein
MNSTLVKLLFYVKNRFVIATVLSAVFVGTVAVATSHPSTVHNSSPLPQQSATTPSLSPTPSPTPSETPSEEPAASSSTAQASAHTSISAASNSNAQCQAFINQVNTDLNAQSATIKAELATYKAMIANMNSSPSQTINGSGDAQSQVTNRAGQQAALNQESDKIDQMQSQFSTSKSNYQNKLIGMGCPYYIGAQG